MTFNVVHCLHVSSCMVGYYFVYLKYSNSCESH